MPGIEIQPWESDSAWFGRLFYKGACFKMFIKNRYCLKNVSQVKAYIWEMKTIGFLGQ